MLKEHIEFVLDRYLNPPMDEEDSENYEDEDDPENRILRGDDPIVRAYIVPDLNSKYSMLLQLEKTETNILYFEELIEQKGCYGKHAEIKVKTGALTWEKRPAIEHLTEQKSELEGKLDEIDANPEFKQNLQTAFVTFYKEQ